VGENSPLFINNKIQISMNKGIKFDFSKVEVTTNKLRWIKTLKEVFCISLKDAKDAVDCGSYFHDLSEFSDKNDAINFYNVIVSKIARLIDGDYSDAIKFVWIDNEQKTSVDIVKVGSVYILTQERYEKLLKAEQTWLMIKAALCNE
jgi:hypothetical protein